MFLINEEQRTEIFQNKFSRYRILQKYPTPKSYINEEYFF